jgi:hypothetical protein
MNDVSVNDMDATPDETVDALFERMRVRAQSVQRSVERTQVLLTIFQDYFRRLDTDDTNERKKQFCVVFENLAARVGCDISGDGTLDACLSFFAADTAHLSSVRLKDIQCLCPMNAWFRQKVDLELRKMRIAEHAPFGSEVITDSDPDSKQDVYICIDGFTASILGLMGGLKIANSAFFLNADQTMIHKVKVVYDYNQETVESIINIIKWACITLKFLQTCANAIDLVTSDAIQDTETLVAREIKKLSSDMHALGLTEDADPHADIDVTLTAPDQGGSSDAALQSDDPADRNSQTARMVQTLDNISSRMKDMDFFNTTK